MLLRNTLTGLVEDMPESMLTHPHFGLYLKKARTAKPLADIQVAATTPAKTENEGQDS